jgi:hypothetical protein
MPLAELTHPVVASLDLPSLLRKEGKKEGFI